MFVQILDRERWREERRRDVDLNGDDGTVQIEDSANALLGGVVWKPAHVYRAFVVDRHFYGLGKFQAKIEGELETETFGPRFSLLPVPD